MGWVLVLVALPFIMIVSKIFETGHGVIFLLSLALLGAGGLRIRLSIQRLLTARQDRRDAALFRHGRLPGCDRGDDGMMSPNSCRACYRRRRCADEAYRLGLGRVARR